MQKLISLHNIHKHFLDGDRKLEVLREINLEVFQGELLVILGPSGSGKSTLLRIMAGLEPQSSGVCRYAKHVRTSFIFQNFALFPWLTVYQNIEFGLKMEGVPSKERHKQVLLQIKEMGLEGFEAVYPRELSGGMKQRVGIARALAINPQIIFLDEPFSALDSFTAKKLRTELLKIWREKKVTMVMVTHLIEEALQLADRIAIVGPRPASIEALINNTLSRPRNLRSKSFFAQADKISDIIRV